MKIVDRIILSLMALPLILCGCNQEDDIYEIFSSDTWHWNASYTTTNWKDDNNAKLHINLDRDKVYEINKDPNVYIIKFETDGNFTAKGNSISFTGKWSANPEDHSVSISGVNIQGNPAGLDRMFYEEIRTAKYYRGDRLVLKLFNSARNEFIQFHPKGLQK